VAGMGLPGLWLFLLVVVGASIDVAVLGLWLADRTRGEDDDRGATTSSLSPFLTTVALVYGALLGFTVVVAWEPARGDHRHVPRVGAANRRVPHGPSTGSSSRS
jgi:hypothetical protein